MIEGLVMELYKDYVIVMTKSGEFLKLRKRGIVNVGDIYKEKPYRRIPITTFATAAALIFVFTSFAGYRAYANQIVGYVDISGSKDIRLYVSRMGTVEKIDGLENANQIKNLPINKAVEELNTIAAAEGIYNDNREVAVTTTEVKPSKLDFNKVSENVKKIISKENKKDKTAGEEKSKGLKKSNDNNKKNDNKDNNNNNNNNNKNNKKDQTNNLNNGNNQKGNSNKNNTAVEKAKDKENLKDKNNNRNNSNDKNKSNKKYEDKNKERANNSNINKKKSNQKNESKTNNGGSIFYRFIKSKYYKYIKKR